MQNLKFKHKIFIFLIQIIAFSWRIKINGILPKRTAVVMFWHSKMLPAWYIFRKENAFAVVSQSKDGEILSSILSNWGLSLIRGSSSKNSKETLAEMVEIAKSNTVLITPDGPRGPRNKMKAGAVITAQRSEAELYYCNIEIKHKIIFNKSWDLFEFPYPFSKIIINISEPILIDKNLQGESLNNYILELEKNMP